MLVTLMGPRETIKWFESTDRQHEIICFIITANPRHREVIKNIAQHHIDADAALGKRVGFLVFGGTDARDYQDIGHTRSGQIVMPGEFLQASVSPLKAWVYDSGGLWDGSYSSARKFSFGSDYPYNFLARETATVADDWMTILEVGRNSLPALCILVKGGEPVVISLGDNFDEHRLLLIFGRLADIAQRDSQKIMKVGFDAEMRIRRAEELQRKISNLKKRLVQRLEVLCNRFNATSEQKQVVVQFLASERYTEKAIEQLFSECGFSRLHEDLKANSTMRRVRDIIKPLERAADDFKENLLSVDEVKSLTESLYDLRARREETVKLVERLKTEGVDARGLDKASFGQTFDNTTSRANQVAALLEKVGKLWTWATGTALFMHLLK